MNDFVLWHSLPDSLMGKVVKLLLVLALAWSGIWVAASMLGTIPTSDDPTFVVVAAALAVNIFCGISALILILGKTKGAQTIDLASLEQQGLVCEETEGRGELLIGLILLGIAVLIVIMGVMRGVPIAVTSIIFWIPSLLFLHGYFSLRRYRKIISATHIIFTSGTPTIGADFSGSFVMGCRRDREITLTILCERHFWYSKEGSTSRSIETLHQNKIALSVGEDEELSTLQGSLEEFVIPLPNNLPGSQINQDGSVIIWSIRAEGKAIIERNINEKVRKQSFSRTWIIPVVNKDNNADALSKYLDEELG
ncbi:MAG: hypothetical protein V7765_10755 [Oleispira sp.]